MSFIPKDAVSIVFTTIALAATLVPSVFIDVVPLPIAGIFHTLSGGLVDGDATTLTAQQSTILFSVRLPRVVVAALVGAALATAGVAYQAVFRSPLADPYLLDIPSGTSLTVTVAVFFGVAAAAIPLVDFLGSVLVIAATYVADTSLGDRSSPVAVILAGVAVAAFANAMQQFLL